MPHSQTLGIIHVINLKQFRQSGLRPGNVFSQTKRLLVILGCAGCATQGLALDWRAESGGRSAALTVISPGRTGFSLLPATASGIVFTHHLPEWRHLTNHILLNGSGVAAGDIDGDGWCDLYFCQSTGSNVLYRNLGNWRFENITDQGGVACANLTSTGATFVDLDGDGDLDLIVNTVGNGTHLFYNDGQGRFTEAAFVLNGKSGGMTVAVADVNGDGYPDLYLANHRTSALMDMPGARFTFQNVNGKTEVATFNGRPTTDPDLRDRFLYDPLTGMQEQGEVHALYLNQGGTHFTLVPFTEGAFLDVDGRPLATPPRDWGLTAMFHDVNGDGLPDLYVCNDFLTEDRFWINQGGGKFRLLPLLSQRKSSLSSMAVDFADINRDGFVDFMVLDMMSRSHRERMLFLHDRPPVTHTPGLMENRPQYELNTLFLNRGDTTFAEIAQLSGLPAAEWAWSCAFLDVDLDGWEDLLVINGMESAGRDLDVAEYIKKLRASRHLSDAEVLQTRRMFPRQATANLIFRNRGDLTFEETGRAWGFDWKGVSSSMALADLDNDGDLDVIVNNLNDAAGIFRNNAPAPRIAVRLRGQPPNTRGIGAHIKVLGGAVPMQSQEMICGGRYLAGDDAMRTFAAGIPTNQLRLEVTWRGGRRSVVADAQPNRIYELSESEAGAAAPPAAGVKAPEKKSLLADVSERIGHRHHEEPFDDFARQSLLPNKLSQLGPGVSWFDLDGDGWDDLIIGSGRGGQPAVFINNGLGGFRRLNEAPLNQPVSRDQTAMLGWPRSAGQTVLLAGSANYEEGPGQGASVQLYGLTAPTLESGLPAMEASTGPLALADIDGDGALDLFVGGRVIAGRYPVAASSLLFHNEQGKFQLDTGNSRVLEKVGLVSGAVFSDLDGDGFPELVLACEWGPPRIFHNDRGRLSDVTGKMGLDKYLGWWNSVTVGDFDGDGRLDIAAGNWGQNTKYEAHRARPLQLYYGDFTEAGAIDLIEAYFEPQLRKIVPERQLNPMAAALPFLRERFASHRAYSTAGIEDILGAGLKKASVWEANWLESTVFLNRGDHFEPRILPVEAQMAPAFGICVGDIDGDGAEDLFLAQNFFDSQAETPRSDAGRGLWLQGDGHGGFRALSGQESGVQVYGEQRGAAVGDFDADGRLDLVVTQNGAETKLYRNVEGKPGLRVRLSGPPGNPHGVGAVVGLIFGQRKGPVREIHAGAGYWSQDSAVQVMGMPESPTQIWVRWPGGKTTTNAVPPAAVEIALDLGGNLRVLRSH